MSILLSLLAIGSCNIPNDSYPPDVDKIFTDQLVNQLVRASCGGHAREISKWIEEGVDPNALGKEQFTPLLYALSCQNEIGVISLLQNGANPNQVSGETHTPIIAASHLSNPRFVQILLDYGANPEYLPHKARNTALAEAFNIGFQNDAWDTYDYLLNYGVNLNQTMTTDGRDIAVLAASLNRYDKVYELIEKGYDRDLEKILRYAQRSTVAQETNQNSHRLRVIELLTEK